jgi:hypothetical protein
MSTVVDGACSVATIEDLRARLGGCYNPRRDDYVWLMVHVCHAVFCLHEDEDEYARVAIDALDKWALEAQRGKWTKRRVGSSFPF